MYNEIRILYLSDVFRQVLIEEYICLKSGMTIKQFLQEKTQKTFVLSRKEFGFIIYLMRFQHDILNYL